MAGPLRARRDRDSLARRSSSQHVRQRSAASGAGQSAPSTAQGRYRPQPLRCLFLCSKWLPYEWQARSPLSLFRGRARPYGQGNGQRG